MPSKQFLNGTEKEKSSISKKTGGNMALKIIIESASKEFNGTISVSIILIKDGKRKPYPYLLPSQYDLERAEKLCRRRKYGTALNLLKKRNIKTEGEIT
jgi:hypothetical protein